MNKSMKEVSKEDITFVEFLFPGSFFPEEETKQVKTRNKPRKIPEGAFAYSFFDVEKTTVGEEEFWGTRKNHSGRFYPEGQILTVEEVKKQVPDSSILVSNMKCNGWDKIVRTRRGNFQPFNEEDQIV